MTIQEAYIEHLARVKEQEYLDYAFLGQIFILLACLYFNEGASTGSQIVLILSVILIALEVKSKTDEGFFKRIALDKIKKKDNPSPIKVGDRFKIDNDEWTLEGADIVGKDKRLICMLRHDSGIKHVMRFRDLLDLKVIIKSSS